MKCVKEKCKKNATHVVAPERRIGLSHSQVEYCSQHTEPYRAYPDDFEIKPIKALKKCANTKCRKERPISEMSVCMDSRPIERYVCDLKCMKEFYSA